MRGPLLATKRRESNYPTTTKIRESHHPTDPIKTLGDTAVATHIEKMLMLENPSIVRAALENPDRARYASRLRFVERIGGERLAENTVHGERKINQNEK